MATKKINTDLKLEAKLLDASGSAGTNGQILSSTGTVTDWISLSELQGVDGSGTANYLPAWTDGDTLGDSILSSTGGDLTLNGSDDNPHIYINTSGGDIGDTARIRFNGRAEVGYIDSSVMLTDGGANKDIKLKVNTGSIFFQTNNSTRMTVDDGGNVGVGTSDPDQKFHVNSGATNHVAKFESTDSVAEITIQDSSKYTRLLNVSADFKIMPNDGASEFVFEGDTGNFLNPNHIRFVDGGKAQFGDSQDLEIFHDATNSNINNKVGHLVITNFADDGDVIFKSDDGAGDTTPYMRLDGGNEHVTVEATNGMLFNDNVKVKLGTGQDFQAWHNATDTYLINNTGHLNIINTSDDKDIIFKSDDGSGGTVEYFKVDGSLVNGTTTLGAVNFPDKSKIFMGTGSDFRMYHDGTDSFVSNTTGNLYVENTQDDGDIIFKSDDGSGATTSYMVIDGSALQTRFYQNTRHTDNIKANFGDGDDLEIFHNGTDSSIRNFTGDFIFRNTAADKDIVFQADDGLGGTENYIQIDGSAGRTLFNKHIRVNDNVQVQVGSSADMQIYHDGSNSYIADSSGSGGLRISTNQFRVYNAATDELIINANEDSSVELYYDNDKKFETTSTGVAITSTGTGDSLLITNTDDSSDAAPVITLKRDSSTPADGDYLGQLKFKGESDTGVERVYAKITAKTSDVSNEAEDGLIETAVRSNGSNLIVSRQTHEALKLINGTGLEVDGNTTFTGNVNFDSDIILDDGSGASPHIIFQDDDDVKFRVYNADTNQFHITREGNSGADFILYADATDYTNSYFTIGGSTVSPTKIGQWDTAYTHSQSVNEHIDWTADQGATNIHANNITGYLKNTTDTFTGSLAVESGSVTLQEGNKIVFDQDGDGYSNISFDNTSGNLIYNSASQHYFKNGEDDSYELVKAGGFIKDGGTSSQFLKANGSVDSNTYVTASTLSNYVDTTTAQTIGGVKTFSDNLGVGQTSPDAKLHINRAESTYAINLGNTDTRAGLKIINSTNDDSQLTFSQGGSGVQYIQASNQAGTAGKDINLNPYGGNVVSAGTFTGTNFILSSDSRLKNSVKDVDNSRVDVDWKTFEMKSNEGQKRYGVIAQELEEKHPEFVRTDDEGMKSVAYVDLLIAKIAELEARLEKLEK